MDNTILGKTTLEHMPPEFRHGEHPRARKPWPIIIILLVAILFGFFWWYEKNRAVSEPSITVAPTQPSLFHQDFSEIMELQLALASMPISGFEDSF
jgi:hypothetical protein